MFHFDSLLNVYKRTELPLSMLLSNYVFIA